MFCKRCGYPLEEGAAACSQCGTPVSDEIAIDSAFQSRKPNIFGLAMGIVGVFAVVVLAVVALNFSFINNFLHKTFSTPESYYRYVEKKTVKKWAAQAGEWYDAYMAASLLYADDITIKRQLSIEVSEEGQSMLALARLMGYDLTWFQSGSISLDSASTEDAELLEGHISLNQQEILSGNMIVDVPNENVYIQIPELTETFLGIHMTEILDAGGQEQMAFNKNMAKIMPNRKTVEKLTEKYLLLMLDYLDDVEMERDILEVDDISQKVTALTVTIDNKTMGDMWEAILEEMQDDEEIEKIIKDMAEASDPEADTDEAYEEFLQELEDSVEELHEYFFEYVEKTMVMTIYVDNKGNIRGREIEWIEDVTIGFTEFTNTMTISMLMPAKGSQFGYELRVFGSGYGEDRDIRLSGSGRKRGTVVDGDFTVEYNDLALLDLEVTDLDTKKFMMSQIEGTVEIKLNKDLGKLLLDSDQLASAVEGIKFVLQGSSGKNEAETSLDFFMGDDSLVTVTALSQTENKADISFPKEGDIIMAEDAYDFQDWFDEIDWDELISHLEGTDLPDNAIDAIEDFSYELRYLMQGITQLGMGIYDIL